LFLGIGSEIGIASENLVYDWYASHKDAPRNWTRSFECGFVLPGLECANRQRAHSSPAVRQSLGKAQKMKLRIFQVDAFTDRVFHGNPAAVCPLETWLPDELMQQIAMENNLAETAFFVKMKNRFEIRWFTPKVEVDLCGHATLATAFVIFEFEGFRDQMIEFDSRSGLLHATKDQDFITLDFPSDPPVESSAPKGLYAAMNLKPAQVYRGKSDFMLIYTSAAEIESLKPDMRLLSEITCRGIIVTAPGEESDFVSRFFAPQSGIDEDPVTGSAHTTLTPYWAAKLGRNELTAQQLSARRGWLQCRLAGDRVKISGQARAYMSGEITLE
jgi:PhzF family phenazine biosynthesis protein